MKTLLTVLFLLACTCVRAQNCYLITTTPKDTITCGQSISLSAFGQGLGIPLLNENFNNGSYGQGWSSTTQATWTNPCSLLGVDGTKHVWMGNASQVPRAITTAYFNLTGCTQAGVTLCFDMKFAMQGDNYPCEGPDLPYEGVYVQYRTPTDTGWLTIHYFNPNGGYDPMLINWHKWCFNVPAAALGDSTRFRFYQNTGSGADHDHWGIDNVALFCNDTSYNIIWEHDGYNAGPTGGTNPVPVTPQNTTSYPVMMTNGTNICHDTITIIVKRPELLVNAGIDTITCGGACVQLNGNTRVIQERARVVTFRYEDSTTLFYPPIPPSMPMPNIQANGLSYTTISPSTIDKVCIRGIRDMSTANVSFSLVCPDGQAISLTQLNVTSAGLGSHTFQNTCFVAGGGDITNSTAPYTGDWAPQESFDNLTGCMANGNWSLRLSAPTLLIGVSYGWSISFNEPEVTGVGSFIWEPVTNMIDSNTLTPTVCPTVTTTYTLTLTDTLGCATTVDSVVVVADSCIGGLASPFTDNGSAWYITPQQIGKTDNCSPIEATNTTIDNISCSQIPGVGCVFVRNDTVYRIVGDSTFFVYDYNAASGDVWQIYDAPDTATNFPGTAVIIKIDSIDTVVIRNHTLRRKHSSIADSSLANTGYVLGDVIESIGSNHYFLPQHPQTAGDSLPFVSCFYSDLTGAVSFNETGITPVDSCVCQILLGNLNTSAELRRSLRFNTFQKTITYNSSTATPATIAVYNVLGQKLREEKTMEHTYTVSVSTLSPGAYLATAYFKDNKLLSLKFIVTD